MIFTFLCLHALAAIAAVKLLLSAYTRHEQKRFNEAVSEQVKKNLSDLQRLCP